MKIEAKKVPFFNPAAPSIRDLIILSLSEEWPLTARQIYAKIRSQTSSSITYQGVHKAVKQLEANGILSSKDNRYQVDLAWLKELGLFSDLVRRKYLKRVSEESSMDKMSFVFDTLREADEFLMDIMEEFDPPPGMPLHLCWNHYWIPLFLKHETYRKMKKAIERLETYSITPANTPLDKWCYDYWGKKGLKNKKIGAKMSSDYSVIVFGDVVIQLYYPAEITTALDRVFAKAQSPLDVDMDALFENVFEKKTRIPVIITKNPALAEHFRTQITREVQTENQAVNRPTKRAISEGR
jgi:hypothetical protein